MELYNEIVKVAHDIYEKSGRIEGRDLENWLEAEKLVMERYRKQEIIGAEKPAPKKRASITKKSTKKAAAKAKKTKA